MFKLRRITATRWARREKSVEDARGGAHGRRGVGRPFKWQKLGGCVVRQTGDTSRCHTAHCKISRDASAQAKSVALEGATTRPRRKCVAGWRKKYRRREGRKRKPAPATPDGNGGVFHWKGGFLWGRDGQRMKLREDAGGDPLLLGIKGCGPEGGAGDSNVVSLHGTGTCTGHRRVRNDPGGRSYVCG